MGTRAELPATFEETLSALLRTRSDERRWALINHATTWPEGPHSKRSGTLAVWLVRLWTGSIWFVKAN